MNGFLWLGVASTAVLVAAFLFDGVDELFESVDMGSPWFTLPVIAAFLGAFGFATGATVTTLGMAALAVGAATGLGFAYLAMRLSRLAMHMETDPTETEADLLASFGRILISPTPTRYGEVLLHRPGGPLKVACTAESAIAAGTEVVVVDVRSSTLVAVAPFDDPSNPEPRSLS
jgi:hypothetical protein